MIPPLGPFDPLVISAGIITNLAYDILKHRLQSERALEDSLFGKILKWAGIREPNFEERLLDTLSKTLGRYFKEYPQYALSAIVDFFQDPAVSRQIGDYILDRRPIDHAQLQLAFEQHFSTAYFASKILFQQRGLSSKQVIDDFISCYRRVLGEEQSIPLMGILLDIMEQADTIVNEIRLSEQRLIEHVNKLIETKLSPQALQVAYLTGQHQLAQELAIEVRASLAAPLTQSATQVATTSETLEITQGSTVIPPLFISGLCGGYLFQSTKDHYFVSHGFDPETLADWREVIVEAMIDANITSASLKPYFSGDTILSGFRLCAICEKLYSADFSLFLLPAIENPNVYIELGFAIGLGVPFLLIREREAAVAPVLKNLGLYTQLGSLRAMRRELAGKVKEYHFGAVRFIQGPNRIPLQTQYIIGAGEQFDDEDFEWAVTQSLEKAYGLSHNAISLSSEIKAVEGVGLPLKQLVEVIQTSRFCLYRIDQASSATTFLALGISLGLNRPLIMLHKIGKEVPYDIQGISTYKFPNFKTLKDRLVIDYRDFFNRYK